MTEPPGTPSAQAQPQQAQSYQVQPQQAPALDPWGRPLPSSDPAASRTALARASARLHTWLAVLGGVLALLGLLGALALFFGGRAGLGVLITGLPPAVGWLLGLAALLILALSAVYVVVLLQARELLRRLADRALDADRAIAPDAPRIERLRRLLAGWLVFGQWGTVAGALLGAVLQLAILRGARTLAESLGAAADGNFGQLGSGVEAVQVVSGLVASVPGVVITWLILGAILRLMNLAVLRASGVHTAPLTPAARTVNTWFLVCLILIGLQLLNLLLVSLGLLVAFVSLWQSFSLGLPETWTGLLHWAGPLLGGALLYSALLFGLYFALLLYSRTYASALADLLDPAAPPTSGLPTGSAGERPNTFRGQF